MIPYPNEMNLMATFLTAVAAATTKAGGALKAFGAAMAAKFAAGRKRLREFRLFAKEIEAEVQRARQAADAGA